MNKSKENSTAKISQENLSWLYENKSWYEHAKAGVGKHLSENDAQRLLSIAKVIDSKVDFRIKECQDCIDTLIKFVYSSIEIQNG